jgi:hypothetical protein
MIWKAAAFAKVHLTQQLAKNLFFARSSAQRILELYLNVV